MREREPDPDAIDYYARIGARPEADAEAIERRRKQADRRFSPMGTSSDADEKRHMQINEASNVLENPDRRERYDALYDALGPINGTLAYETLSTDVVDSVREDGTLSDHLQGFVEILGPQAGARQFQRYHDDLTTPLSAEFADTDLPHGYEIDDAGFGIAAWSWYQADRPCPFSLWLTGGRQLWRTAVVDPDAIDEQLDALRNNDPASVPTPARASPDTSGQTVSADGTPTTQITLGHPSSGAVGPSTGYPGNDTDDATRSAGTVSNATSWLATPLDRLGNVVSYVGATGLWTGGSLAGTVGGGLAGTLVVLVAFVPLLAVALVVQSSIPDVSAVGLPLVSLDSPLATESLISHLAVGALIAVPAWVTSRYVVPLVDERKETDLPRDAWLVFGLILLSLSGALVVGLGRSSYPQSWGLGVTALLAAFTFQASMDVGAPRLLSLLCRGAGTAVFGLAGSVVAVAVVGLPLRATEPAVFETFAGVLARIPLLEQPIFALANARVLAVAGGTVAFVPLALTTLYSLAYAVESVALRLRSRASS